MNNDKHIINKQILELSLHDNLEAVNVQKRISEVFRSKLFPRLDELFTNLSGKNDVLRIEKLELDIGDININKIEEEIVSKSIAALENKLSGLIYQHKEENKKALYGGRSKTLINKEVSSTYINKNQSQFEQLVHYLKYGVFPWWKSSENKITIRELVEEVKKNIQPAEQEILLKLIEYEQVRSRVAYQFKGKEFEQLLTLLPGKVSGLVLKINKQLKLEAAGKKERIMSIFRLQLLSKVQEIQKQKPTITLSYLVDKIVTYIVENKALKLQTVLLSEVKEHISTLGLNKKQKQELITQIEQQENITNKAKTEHIKKAKETEFEELNKEDVATSDKKEEVAKKNNTSEEEQKESSPQKADGEYNEFAGKTDVSGATEQADKIKQEEMTPESIKMKEKLEKAKSESKKQKFKLNRNEETFYIKNAGLVLLNPYLFYFFDGLGLLNSERKFESEDAACRGVHLLQYLVTGETATEEQDLVLNKILCGLDISESIPFDVELSSYEIEECIILLETVTTRWEALKTKDINAVKANFLNREGKLTHAGNGWNVYIERETLDLLIDKLPWPISIIRQPWIDEIIYVEW